MTITGRKEEVEGEGEQSNWWCRKKRGTYEVERQEEDEEGMGDEKEEEEEENEEEKNEEDAN